MIRKIWISRDATAEDYVYRWTSKPKMIDGLSFVGASSRSKGLFMHLDELWPWITFTPKPGHCYEVIIDHSDVTPEAKP